MRPTLLVMLAFAPLAAGCADPQSAGQQVGQSLYGASVNTGRALAVAGDRTGQAVQGVGSGIRNAFSPPPLTDSGPVALPPPYVPDETLQPTPVTVEPLPAARGSANPSMGY